MNKSIKFQEALDKVSKFSSLLIGEGQKEFQQQSEEFLNLVHESQYIKVPLVGVFSAGKSSLLNVFTEKPGMLPVDTMPETAVAYELYYAETECVELFRNGAKVDSKPLTEIKSLDTKPGDIAKVYCTSDPIKRLQEKGIILVDMPGIGSGIERHDAAIFNYIDKGTAFVLIVDAEQGSLRGSTMSFMQELSQYNMFPAVFVSKIDKKPEKDVKDIVEYIQYQMNRLGNNNPFVGTVCSVNNNMDAFCKYLNNLDADALVTEKLSKQFKNIVNSVISQLKVRIDFRSKDIADADEKIKQIDEEISNVKAELPVGEAELETPEHSTQDILENVRAALEEKAYDIAEMIVNKEDEESIKSVIVSTVRTEIVSSLKEESEQFTSALGVAVQEQVQALAAIDVNPDFMGDFTEILQVVEVYIAKLLNVGGIWGMIIKYLLPFLPDIIKWLFGKSDEEVIEEVKDKFTVNCIDKVIEGIEPTVYKIVDDNQQRIQEKMQQELVYKMEMVKDGLREKINDANKTKEAVAEELAQLNAAVAGLNNLIQEF